MSLKEKFKKSRAVEPSIPQPEEFINAVKRGNIEAVRRFLAAGADPDQGSEKNGDTPLICATRGGHLEIAQMLIKAGADVNKKNNSGAAPLHRAASKSRAEIARLLAKSGALLDARDGDGKTALMIASHWGQAEVACVLVEAGATIYKRKEERLRGSPTYAQWEGHNKIVEMLEKERKKAEVSLVGAIGAGAEAASSSLKRAQAVALNGAKKMERLK